MVSVLHFQKVGTNIFLIRIYEIKSEISKVVAVSLKLKKIVRKVVLLSSKLRWKISTVLTYQKIRDSLSLICLFKEISL